MAIRDPLITSLTATFKKILLSAVLLPSVSLALPMEYTASYNIEKFGMVVAKSDYSLKHENNGVRLIQHSEPVGLAALLRNDTLDENSFLSVKNDQLLLTEFSYKQKSPDKKNRDIQLKIDWVQSENKLLGNVSGTVKGKKISLNLNKPAWDTSTYQIPLMANTREGTEPQKITMIVKGRFAEYTFITHGSEEIEVNGNTIKAIKIERDSGTHKSPIYLWLAPSLNNLPVKIEKWKNGKLQLTMLLNHAKFASDSNIEFNAVVEHSEEFDDL
ncbi:DUF3108 domain-containing protein [Pseudomonadota bacterium]